MSGQLKDSFLAELQMLSSRGYDRKMALERKGLNKDEIKWTHKFYNRKGGGDDICLTTTEKGRYNQMKGDFLQNLMPGVPPPNAREGYKGPSIPGVRLGNAGDYLYMLRETHPTIRPPSKPFTGELIKDRQPTWSAATGPGEEEPPFTFWSDYWNTYISGGGSFTPD